MKKTSVLALLIVIMSVRAYGIGFFGTPTAELEQGQFNIGFNYTYISTDLAKTKMAGGDELISLRIEDNNIHRYYGVIGAVGYGLTDAWELYLRLGFADVKAQIKSDEPGNSRNGVNFDDDFAWGWGTRYTFYKQDDVRWGATVQMNWLDTDSDNIESNRQEQIGYESYDLLVGVGPTIDKGGWRLYGGPFFYTISGDLEIKGTEALPVLGAGDYALSGDLEEDSNFGVFIGAQRTVLEKYDLTSELSFTGDGWAFGSGISVPF